ncbi:hypothetical protein K1719_012159 [Acacia pycnantha]|nr:hypothetical protein K1719_012159 [Acacia pycnantha]
MSATKRWSLKLSSSYLSPLREFLSLVREWVSCLFFVVVSGGMEVGRVVLLSARGGWFCSLLVKEQSFWVPRGSKSPAWVSVKYERIQNFCFFCGKVGHDGRACKDPKANKDHGVEPFGFGSWMGTAAVRTIEEALVCKESWCEAGMFFGRAKV